MYAFETEKRAKRLRLRRGSQRGAALVSTLVIFSSLLGMIYLTTVTSMEEAKASRRGVDDVRVKFVAESAVERAIHFLRDAVKKTNTHDPIGGLEGIFDGEDSVTLYVGEPLMDGEVEVGAYSVTLTNTDLSADEMTITIDATGYLPTAPMNLGPGEQVSAWESLSVVVNFTVEPSGVFDYGYFINNWGWLYGSTIEVHGNAGSNGQFDVGGYSPFINGQPTYDSVAWSGSTADLVGYHDDNGDGLTDGDDGGIFAGWDIVSSQNVTGGASDAANQHDFEDAIDMPNLTDLTSYEDTAVALGSGIQVSGGSVSDAVFGDDFGETGNLYLVGTAADPIIIDGPVVVRGDVIISGYVSGQGAIYTEGNVYVPDSIKYVDPPTSTRPADKTEAATEQWLSDNKDKDFLGLFAKENIVVGDYTNWTWQYYVSGWMGSSMNRSDEDAGEDGIPNTSDGIDGIAGTADDDVLEDDGVYTVEYYSDSDAALGLIPSGFNVGDAVPGSGEDIDGDGQYDDSTTMADLTLSTALTTANWGGNMPVGGIANYSDISSLYADNLDAVFYTNHSFCYVVFGSNAAKMNGALVSRNENIVYGTPSIEINYDCRLLGGSSGSAGDLLPKSMPEPVVLSWRRQSVDPNRYLMMP